MMKKEIFLKKEQGISSMITGIMPIMFAIIFISILATVSLFYVQKERLQDELVLSTLSALQPDPMEYGKTGRIIITDTGKAYSSFQEILRHNMSLNSDFSPKDTSFFKGPVRIESFIIYNNEVGSFKTHNLTNFITNTTMGNSITAPNGQTVTRTAVYVKISFPYELFGKEYTGYIDNLTAIMRQ